MKAGIYALILLLAFTASHASAADQRFAVIVGLGKYASPDIPPLRYAKADAEAMHAVLTDPNRGGFIPENVRLLTDERATQVEIRSALGTWLSRRAMKGDTVVIYYAGHGAPESDPTGDSPDGFAKYLVPYDARPEDLYATGIAMEEIQNVFKRIESERLIFIADTCYSGATGGRTFLLGPSVRALNLTDQFMENITQGEGRVFISSAGVKEPALELNEVGHGLFTYYLVSGIEGQADVDSDGYVGITEIYKYVYDSVVRHARLVGGNQHPVMKGNVTGEIYLARVPEGEKGRDRARRDSGILVVMLDRSDVQVSVNGNPMGASTPGQTRLEKSLPPGGYTVEAKAPDGSSMHKTALVKPNEMTVVTIPFGSPPRGLSSRRILGATLMGSGIAGLLGSAGFAAKGYSDSMGLPINSEQDVLTAENRWDDSTRTLIYGSSVSVALFGAGAILYLFSPSTVAIPLGSGDIGFLPIPGGATVSARMAFRKN